nr:gustatory receptor 18.1 [Papilio dardanus]
MSFEYTSESFNEMYNYPVDTLSKIYIVIGWLMGINRLPVAFKVKGYYYIASLIYSLILNNLTGYYVLNIGLNEIISLVRVICLIQYFLSSFIAIKSGNVLKKFYNELFEFDKEINFQRPITLTSRINFGLFVILISGIIINFVILVIIVEDGKHELIVLNIMDLSNVIESFFNAHLFSLFQIRLKFIRILLVSSFPHENQMQISSENENINFNDINIFQLLTRYPEVEIRKLLLLYYKLIKAYDYLNTAIKWQLFSNILTSFMSVLNLLHFMLINFNKSNVENLQIVVPGITLIIIRGVPFLMPCFIGSNISKEVTLLRGALFKRTHLNVFDVTSHSYAKLFLNLIQARSLTFSVFRMIEINRTLPFKFLGLLATYTLILIQFEKVVNFEKKYR